MIETAWHSSPHLFDWPRIMPERNPGRHDNGALGLWVTLKPIDKRAVFGKYLYELTYEAERMKIMDLSEFARLSYETKDYEALRKTMVCDVLKLDESAGIMQGIILNLDMIRTWKQI